MATGKFDNMSALDPFKQQQQTLVALPSAVLDNFTLLDPFLFRARVNAAQASTLDIWAPYDIALQNEELQDALG